jgi:hypothetical protein
MIEASTPGSILGAHDRPGPTAVVREMNQAGRLTD